MADKTIAQKLQIKEGEQVLIVNAPKRYKVGALPKNAAIVRIAAKAVDVIQVFVTSKKELKERLWELKPSLKPKGILWVTYPKGTSSMETDLNRDIIRKFAQPLGFETVAIFSVDEVWSALRLKVRSDDLSRQRKSD